MFNSIALVDHLLPVAYISSPLTSMVPLKIYIKYNKGLDRIILVSVCAMYKQVILTCNNKCKSQPSVKGYMIASCLVGVYVNKLVHILLIKGLLRVFDGDQLGGTIFPLHLLSLVVLVTIKICVNMPSYVPWTYLHNVLSVRLFSA